MTTEFVRQDLAHNVGTAAEPDRVRVIREGVASYLPDIDPDETASGWRASTTCCPVQARHAPAI